MATYRFTIRRQSATTIGTRAVIVSKGISGPAGATGPAGSGIELLTTKGDLLGYSTEGVRIPVGTNGYALVSRSSATPGVAWEAVYAPGGTDVAVADGGTGASTEADARANLGLVIGTDVQAYSAVLANTTASFTTADETKLDGIEALADVTDAANVSAAGALMLVAGGASVENIGAVESNVSTVAATGATETLDTSLYGVFDVTMDQNCTFTFSNPAPSGKCTIFALVLRGAFTPTFPAAVDWAGGAAPTYTTPSVYTFTTVDAGTTWLGQLVGAAFA